MTSMRTVFAFLGLALCQSFTLQQRHHCIQWRSSNGVTVSTFKDGSRHHHHETTFLKMSSTMTDTLSTVPSLEVVESLTETAVYECDTEAGLEALRDLAMLCEQRIPFDFEEEHRRQKQNRQYSNERVIHHLPQLLPTSTRNEFLNVVQRMESNQWLSQNPDSVDGLPSLHLNIVSDGEPLFPVETSNASAGSSDYEFQKGIQELYKIVQPYVYDVLLPQAKDLLGRASSSSLRVSDVFLRRYGQDICGGDRSSISAHYDVFSRVTAVVALDNVAADGRNGLFTTAIDETTGRTSNHKTLRRFFPLQAGDAVLHTWDVLHGVDVEPGLDRTSLIVWFDEHPDPDKDKQPVVSPWLTNHPNRQSKEPSNDVLQFVLASALSSVDNEFKTRDLENEIQLYVGSASQRNTFALTRMGSLCEDGALNDKALNQKAFRILDSLRTKEQLPQPLQEMLDKKETSQELAVRFWLEGALGGNPLAQKALADELMMVASQSGSEQLRTLAAVLFALAAQQGDESASAALSRVVEFDVTSRGVETEEDFFNSPVVQVANAAIVAL